MYIINLLMQTYNTAVLTSVANEAISLLTVMCKIWLVPYGDGFFDSLHTVARDFYLIIYLVFGTYLYFYTVGQNTTHLLFLNKLCYNVCQ